MDRALMIFPYREDAKGSSFPIVPLHLYVGEKGFDSSALIDSGATVSVFRPEVALNLGLSIESGKEVFLGGVGGYIKGYRHEVEIEVAKNRFLCPIVFSREYSSSFNLLGRNAFFEKFRIIFEEKKKKVILE